MNVHNKNKRRRDKISQNDDLNVSDNYLDDETSYEDSDDDDDSDEDEDDDENEKDSEYNEHLTRTTSPSPAPPSILKNEDDDDIDDDVRASIPSSKNQTYAKYKLDQMKRSLSYIKCCINISNENATTFPKQNELHRWLDSHSNAPLSKIDIVC